MSADFARPAASDVIFAAVRVEVHDVGIFRLQGNESAYPICVSTARRQDNAGEATDEVEAKKRADYRRYFHQITNRRVHTSLQRSR